MALLRLVPALSVQPQQTARGRQFWDDAEMRIFAKQQSAFIENKWTSVSWQTQSVRLPLYAKCSHALQIDLMCKILSCN